MGTEPAELRLLHITTVPQSLGFLRNEVAYLDGRARVSIISSPGEALHRFGREMGVAVYPVKMPRRITPLRDLLAVWRMVHILRRERPTIVHAHTPKGGLLGMLSAWLAGTPIRIYRMRGLPMTTANGLRRNILWATEWLACKVAHRVIAVSASLRARAIREGICHRSKIIVVANGSGQGVDARGRFNPSEVSLRAREEARVSTGIPMECPVVGFVGRIARDKGVADLQRAWQQLRSRYRNLHLLVVGAEDTRDTVAPELLRKLRRDPRVHLTGRRSDVPVLLALMDVLVLPTYREGFGNVLLEAAAMAKPVVCTNVEGCIDAVRDGVTGTLVPVGDVQALAQSVARYLDQPNLREKHGRAARNRALDKFRPEQLVEATIQEYRDLLQSRAAAQFDPSL